MAHRALAQSISGVTEAQRRGLALGSVKGTNHRAGYKHREESKQKVAASNKAYWAAHPEQAKERGAKTRGPSHYKWKGGTAQLNQAIRLTTEYRKWADTVRSRDGRCIECGATDGLEAHHKRSLAALVAQHGVKAVDDARACAALWDTSNGVTLCMDCHFAAHGRSVEHIKRHSPRRIFSCELCGEKFTRKPSQLASGRTRFCSAVCRDAGVDQSGARNGNWKGGGKAYLRRQAT